MIKVKQTIRRIFTMIGIELFLLLIYFFVSKPDTITWYEGLLTTVVSFISAYWLED